METSMVSVRLAFTYNIVMHRDNPLFSHQTLDDMVGITYDEKS